MLTVCERASRSIVWKLRCARAKRMRKFLELMRYVSTAPQSREIIARSFDGSVCYPSATERVFSQWSLIHIRLVRNVCVCVPEYAYRSRESAYERGKNNGTIYVTAE